MATIPSFSLAGSAAAIAITGNIARDNIGRMLQALSGIYAAAEGSIHKDEYFSWADRVRQQLETIYPQIQPGNTGIPEYLRVALNKAQIQFRALESAAKSVGFDSYTDLAAEAAFDLPESFKQTLKDATEFVGEAVGNLADAAGQAAGKGLWAAIKNLGVGGWFAVIVLVVVLLFVFVGPGKLFKMVRG
jgi:hypothetical protein